MNQLTNLVINTPHGRPILTDVYYQSTQSPKPVVIFSHGFKGFKDWGAWKIIAQQFADAGFIFVLFNFSHNGTTPDKPDEFADLEAFGNNNYSIELDDLGLVIDTLLSGNGPVPPSEINPHKLYLCGHSRGGGITILKAYEDRRVTAIATWAGVCSYHRHISQGNAIEEWQKKGVIYIQNSRTQQQMPLYYQLYEDTVKNLHRLNIETATQHLHCPLLIVHGTTDPVVKYEEALQLHQWYPQSQLLPIPDANHVFGMRHPHTTGSQLPPDAQTLTTATIHFFKTCLQ